jgi:hypothetical protein
VKWAAGLLELAGFETSIASGNDVLEDAFFEFGRGLVFWLACTGFLVVKVNSIKSLSVGMSDPSLNGRFRFMESLWQLLEDLLRIDKRQPFDGVLWRHRYVFFVRHEK